MIDGWIVWCQIKLFKAFFDGWALGWMDFDFGMWEVKEVRCGIIYMCV